MECVLSGLDGVLCMLDDVLITGENDSQHVERLHLVLQRLQDAGLTLQKDKCEFFKEEVEYLGYTVDKHGLKKSSQKVRAIVTAPAPANVSQLQSFLGLVNYYRNFVPAASSLLSPLYNLLQKGSKWNWGEEHNNAFNTIKNALASDQVLAHFDGSAQIILTVDASPTGLGAVLSQVGKDNIERPVSFASRTLNKAEKRYAQIQKEATAIIFGVRRFHQYLYGRSVPFVLRTDHKPLLSIFGGSRGIPEVTANRLQRYAMYLSAYNFTIEYIKSAENSADFLSRFSLPGSGSDNESSRSGGASSGAHDSHGVSDIEEDRASYINFVIDGIMPITFQELQQETYKDPILTQVIYYINNGWPLKIKDDRHKPYHLCKNELSFESGCVMRGHKIVIPEKLCAKVVSELHGSHLGIVKAKAEARSRFWFPGVDKAIETMIASCEVCRNLRQAPARAPLAVWPYPKNPFQRIHIDFLGPINNNTYLVIVDAHSKWVEVYLMANVSSKNVVIKLQDFMSRFGIPQTIVSDNGTAFISREYQSFCSLNGISHVTSPTYHPASNGQAESFVKIIKKGIKSSIMTSTNQSEISAKLQKYLFDYRNSVNSTTGTSPAELVFGKKLRSRLDLLTEPVIPSSTPSLPLNDHVQRKQYSQSKAYGGTNTQYFDVGNKVIYKNGNKPNSWNTGIIVERKGKVIYIIKDCVTQKMIKKHKNQLMLYKGTDTTPPNTWDSPIELEDVASATKPNSPVIVNTPTAPSPPLPHEDRPLQSPRPIEAEADRSLEEFYDTAAGEGSEVQVEQESEKEPAVEEAGTAQNVQKRAYRSVPRVNYKQFF